MPRAKKVVLEVPETKPRNIDLLSTKAYHILDALNIEFCKMENAEDAKSDYDVALEELDVAESEMRDAIDAISVTKRNLEDRRKDVERQFQNVIKSRMNIKKMSLQLAKLIDEMDKPPKKKRRKKRAKLVIPTPHEMDALESRSV